jgi:hypothetical protein
MVQYYRIQVGRLGVLFLHPWVMVFVSLQDPEKNHRDYVLLAFVTQAHSPATGTSQGFQCIRSFSLHHQVEDTQDDRHKRALASCL